MKRLNKPTLFITLFCSAASILPAGRAYKVLQTATKAASSVSAKKAYSAHPQMIAQKTFTLKPLPKISGLFDDQKNTRQKALQHTIKFPAMGKFLELPIVQNFTTDLDRPIQQEVNPPCKAACAVALTHQNLPEFTAAQDHPISAQPNACIQAHPNNFLTVCDKNTAISGVIMFAALTATSYLCIQGYCYLTNMIKMNKKAKISSYSKQTLEYLFNTRNKITDWDLSPKKETQSKTPTNSFVLKKHF